MLIYENPQAVAIHDRSLVEHLVNELNQHFSQKLCSIYISGHRGVDMDNLDYVDLEISIITTEPFDEMEIVTLTKMKNSMMDQFTFVKSIDFDLAYIHDILTSDNIHPWAYWLKNECTFVAGLDIIKKIKSQYVPRISPMLMIDQEYSPKWQRFCDQMVFNRFNE